MKVRNKFSKLEAGLAMVIVLLACLAAVPIKNAVLQSNLDAAGFQISNLGTPTNSSNAVTVEYLSTNSVADNSVTFAKMADLATDRLIGRDTASTGDPEALTVGNGLEFTGSGGIGIANDGVTFARIQNITDARLLGRSAGSSGDAQEITVGAGLSLSGGALTATGTKSYIYLTHPDLADGTGATLGTTATSINYGRPTFSNSADQAANYVEYYFSVPTDIDTSVAMRAIIKFRLGGADTGTHRYVLSMADVNNSADPTAASLTNAINFDFAGDGSGASGDLETVGYSTLTSWAGALTADHLIRIRLARDGDAAQDGSSVNSVVLEVKIEYDLL